MKVATHMTLMVLLGLEIKGALIATALPKPNQTSERDPLPSLLLNLHKKLNFGV